MRSKYYLGRTILNTWEVLRLTETPTIEEFGGEYNHFTGPFRTKRAAQFMGNTWPNPHCVNVSQAERLAKMYGPDPQNNGRC